jgi:PPM family protein phosphatase
MAGLLFRATALTDVGLVRTHNEDFAAVRDDLGLYMVADGAGGENSGDVAAALALRSVGNYIGATIRATHERPDFDRLGNPYQAKRLSSAIHKANRDVLEIARTSESHRGMGTTFVALLHAPRTGLLHLAHVGDSRCYRLRGGDLELLTEDHSIAQDLLEQRPDLEEAILERLPKAVVTRALGMTEDLRVSVRTLVPRAGDRYLLCSDGLSTPVSTPDLAHGLAQPETPEVVAHVLVELAIDRGAPDNVAVIVVDCESRFEEDEAPTTPWDKEPSFPPPPALPVESSQPELLITGIEEFTTGADVASDSFLEGLVRVRKNYEK